MPKTRNPNPIDEPPPAATSWALSYADLMTLLLAFFVLMASMAKPREASQVQAVVESIQKKFRDPPRWTDRLTAWLRPAAARPARPASIGRALRAEAIGGDDLPAAAPQEVLPEPRIHAPGEPILAAALSFPEGSHRLTPAQREMLRGVVPRVQGSGQRIELCGYAPCRLHSPQSLDRLGWDRAYAQCLQAAEYLLSLGVQPQQMAITVMADRQPGPRAAGQAAAQRVDTVQVLVCGEPGLRR